MSLVAVNELNCNYAALYQTFVLNVRFNFTIITVSQAHVLSAKFYFIPFNFINVYSRPQWPRGLRRGSVAARLAGLRVRIPPGARMSVSCEYFVLSSTGLCDGPIPRPEESFRVCVCP